MNFVEQRKLHIGGARLQLNRVSQGSSHLITKACYAILVILFDKQIGQYPTSHKMAYKLYSFAC